MQARDYDELLLLPACLCVELCCLLRVALCELSFWILGLKGRVLFACRAALLHNYFLLTSWLCLLIGRYIAEITFVHV